MACQGGCPDLRLSIVESPRRRVRIPAQHGRIMLRSGVILRGSEVSERVLWDHLAVKRATAIRRLHDVVDGLDRASGWPGTTVVAAYVHGGLLAGIAEL